MLLRHPESFRWRAQGGGELALPATHLDAALAALFLGAEEGHSALGLAAERAAAEPLGLPIDIPALTSALRSAGLAPPTTTEGAGAVLVEELVDGAAVRGEEGAEGAGKRAWYDTTLRAYCVRVGDEEGGGGGEGGGEGGGGESAPAHAVVIGGARLFPPSPLAATATATCHSQHVPAAGLSHEAMALGAETSHALFSPGGELALPIDALLAALHSIPLRHLITSLLRRRVACPQMAHMSHTISPPCQRDFRILQRFPDDALGRSGHLRRMHRGSA